MCGIAGYSLQADVLPNKKRLENALQIMKHRGPDSSKCWYSDEAEVGLGHVRLSIVDPNARSNQPFFSEDKRYTLIFNGEIYNYLELREELEKKYQLHFSTSSDTEVLLKSYMVFGKKCLSRFQGMFAFALYDAREGELFLARDFVGQKPLVYSLYGGNFYFASEIPALFALADIPKSIDKGVLQFYLLDQFFHIPSPLCIFENISKLAPASFMRVKNGKIVEKKRYALLEKKKVKKKVSEDAFLYKKLEDLKPKDVPYASFLSGGVDSSFICNGLRFHHGGPIDVYTLCAASESRDSDFQRSKFVSSRLSLNQHVVKVQDLPVLSSVRETVEVLGEPYFHITSVFADSLLAQVKKKHRVIFTGAGGDEIYYGYDNLLFLLADCFFTFKKIVPRFLLKSLDTLTKGKYGEFLLSERKTFKKSYYLHTFRKNKNRFLGSFQDEKTLSKSLDVLVDDFASLVKWKSYIDLSYLFGLFYENSHSLIIQSDAVGMKNSIEVRALFLERDVIERAYSLPLHSKLSFSHLREGKKILRDSLCKYLPRSFVYAKKIGFGVHSQYISSVEKRYLPEIQVALKRFEKREVLETPCLKHLFSDFRKHFSLIMKLYALEIWFETFIDEKKEN
ncbi:MAG: asparagine synthase (glutamine-hydrolyzing) [Candidatus Woesearchaeota archaeon]|nr:asparagine synthase (glutamine-hydrolyzing) [Nanoarchaeota archaeon]USN44447.1 MAG: asparagine synthase (glutamine-hydrolyzing) [Candidatus Woesearchaeota archaeon]